METVNIDRARSLGWATTAREVPDSATLTFVPEADPITLKVDVPFAVGMPEYPVDDS